MKQEYYSIKQAAEKLSCKASEVEYLLKEGQLRYAWDTKSQDIPVEILIPKEGWSESASINPKEVKLIKDRFLYLPKFHLDINNTGLIDTLDVTGLLLENYKGQPVVLVVNVSNNDARRKYAYLKTSVNISNPVITSEELRRISKNVSPSKIKSEIFPFVEPSVKPSWKAEALVLYLNAYYSKFGKIPKKKQIVDFILEHSSSQFPANRIGNPRDKKISICGEEMLERQIYESIDRYLKPEFKRKITANK